MRLPAKTTVVFVALFVLLQSILLNTGAVLARPPENPFNLLSDEDKARVIKILQDVSKNEDMPTREVHREFWVIWKKLKDWPEADVQDLKDFLVGPSLIYMRYVWEDALSSLQAGAPQKSKERKKYEKRLYALGILTKEEIEKNDNMINRIAYKEPLTTADGREYVVTEAGIQLVLTGLMDASARIERLFSKEYYEK